MFDKEKEVLEMMSKQLLVTKGELIRKFEGNYKEAEVCIQKLRDGGLIKPVESIGTALVITQKGLRLVNDGH